MIFLRHTMKPANIDGIYKNQSALLICNGPSVNTLDPCQIDRPGIITMGVNNGAHIVRPHLWCSQDEPQKFMPSIWQDPRIMKFTRRCRRKDIVDGKLLANAPAMFYHKLNSGVDPATWLDQESISWAAPSGDKHRVTIFLCALCVLYKLGFRQIAIVGADFKMTETPYFFSEHKSRDGIRSNNELFRIINDFCYKLRPELENRGVSVVNCTPNSGLTAFQKEDLEDWLSRWSIDISGSTYGMYENKPKISVK